MHGNIQMCHAEHAKWMSRCRLLLHICGKCQSLPTQACERTRQSGAFMWNLSCHVIIFPVVILKEETGGIAQAADVSMSILTDVSSMFLSHEVNLVSFCLADLGFRIRRMLSVRLPEDGTILSMEANLMFI